MLVSRSAKSRLISWLHVITAMLALSLIGCDSNSNPTAPGDDHDHGHLHGDRVELHTRGAARALLAVWTGDAGWTDGNGTALAELPAPLDVEGEGLLPLQAGGRNASLTVRYFLPDGSEVEMSTLSRDDDTRERQCSVYSARYYPADDETGIIAWPNIRHPDAPEGAFQFARRANGDLVGLFHCDHIHIYPEAEGAVDLEFVLWHVDHADGHTDPITVRVHGE